MSSLAAARADNFYFPNDFDPNKPSRPKKPDHLKKDYSTIRLFYLIKIWSDVSHKVYLMLKYDCKRRKI